MAIPWPFLDARALEAIWGLNATGYCSWFVGLRYHSLLL